MGPRGRGRAQGVGRALHPRGQVDGPPAVFSVPDILKYSRKKSYFIFRAFGELLFSGYFYIALINQKTDREILFLLYFNKITESKRRVQKVLPSSFIHLMIIKKNPLTRLIKSC